MASDAHSTPAPSAALAEFFNHDHINAMPGAQLAAVLSGLRAAAEALNGVSIQPRCRQGERDYNPAGELLFALADFMMAGAARVAVAAAKVPPSGADDAKARAWVRIRYEAEHMDDLLEVAELAIQGAVAVREAGR